MKKTRQEKIAELITTYEIETQDELIERLREHRFDVTQATVSRDIRELQLTKTLTGEGTYRYVSPKREEMAAGLKFNATLVDSIIGVESAMNIIVIKTYPGLAQAVASSIDAMNMHSILGCVAGDDTIIIVSRDESSSAQISEKIRELMKAL